MEKEQEQIPGQESLPENLPLVEVGTNTETAATAAAEVLQEVKAAEVQTLADVLSRLNEQHQQMTELVSQLTAALSEVNQMKTEIALTLQEIQAERAALKNPPQQQQQTATKKTGLAALLP